LAAGARDAGSVGRQRKPLLRPALKRSRLQQLQTTAERTVTSIQLLKADLDDRAVVKAAFTETKPSKVVNLAAQAGMIYSIEKSRGLHPG